MVAQAHIPEPAVEVLDLRHFSSSALRPLLEEEIRAWSALLDWDYRNSAEMILHYVDGRTLPGYVAVREGSVCGYCFFVYESGKCVVGDLYVSESAEEDHSVSRCLLDHAVATLRSSPGICRAEAQLLLHETGAVARPFLDAGFLQYRRLFMGLPLDTEGGRFEHAGLQGLEVRQWEEHDYHAAAALITDSYRGHIDAHINDQYRDHAGSMRFLNSIIRFMGCGVFDRESSLVAVHRASRDILGLILCSRVREHVAHVTQICVASEHRGRRIGEALLGLSSASLRQRGFSSLTLTVTESNRSAVELYRRLGYQTLRVFDAFVWEE
jgi:ribosomal protein S18 acetylase RimI-like enzyme